MLRRVLVFCGALAVAQEAFGARLLKEARVGWEEIAPAPLHHLWVNIGKTHDEEGNLLSHVRPAPDVSQFVHSHCIQLSTDLHHKSDATPFDRAFLDFMTRRVMYPVERYVSALSTICHITRARSEGEIMVADHCATPEMIAVIDKTVGALRMFDPAQKHWIAWAESKLIPAHESKQESAVLRDSAERGGAGGREPEDDEDKNQKNSDAIKGRQADVPRLPVRSRVPGWKKLLVALLIQSPEAKVLWPEYKGDLLQHVCDGGLGMTFQAGGPPTMHASDLWLREHFNPVEIKLLEALRDKKLKPKIRVAQSNVSAEGAAADHVQAGENIADTTLAATHLTDACEHVSVAHTILDDALVPNEVRQVLYTTRTIVNKDYEPLQILGGVGLMASELAMHGMGSLAALRDVVSLATNSDSILAAIASLRGYVKAKASIAKLGVLVDIVDEVDLAGLLDEDIVQELGADEKGLLSALVKGSDAMVKLSSALNNLPSEICAAYQNNLHEIAAQADRFTTFLHNFQS